MTATDASCVVFPTELGSCVLAWRDPGIVRVRLPGPGLEAAAARLGRVLPLDHSPDVVAATVEAIQLHLRGVLQDLSRFHVDLAGVSDFNRRVYAVTCGIPAGRTLSYGDVARLIGEPRAAQGVGQALGQNPVPLLVPCHRVLSADGRLHGFSAPGGIETKRRILALEGVFMGGGPSLFDHAGLTL
jgi:methylated-DNA-[protein]-cysteine S-methyltransferase